MIDSKVQHTDGDEQQLAGIIRRAGVRHRPQPATRDAVYEAVRGQWRAVVDERRRRRATRWSLAAAAAVTALAVGLGTPLLTPPGPAIASVILVKGQAAIDGGAWYERLQALVPGASVAAGGELRTGPGGRVALQVAGASVRVDQDSTVTLVAADRIALRRGAVYVDTGGDRTQTTTLLIETPLGTVEHLGTQYETRVAGEAVRVMVREGRVRLQAATQSLETGAGEQLTVSATGVVGRRGVSRADEAWAWAGEIAPVFDIDGRPLPDFLRWVGRETGREIAFSSMAAQRAAEAVILRGAVTGLTPLQALGAVLATTPMGYRDAPDGLILVGLDQAR